MESDKNPGANNRKNNMISDKAVGLDIVCSRGDQYDPEWDNDDLWKVNISPEEMVMCYCEDCGSIREIIVGSLHKSYIDYCFCREGHSRCFCLTFEEMKKFGLTGSSLPFSKAALLADFFKTDSDIKIPKIYIADKLEKGDLDKISREWFKEFMYGSDASDDDEFFSPEKVFEREIEKKKRFGKTFKQESEEEGPGEEMEVKESQKKKKPKKKKRLKKKKQLEKKVKKSKYVFSSDDSDLDLEEYADKRLESDQE